MPGVIHVSAGCETKLPAETDPRRSIGQDVAAALTNACSPRRQLRIVERYQLPHSISVPLSLTLIGFRSIMQQDSTWLHNQILPQRQRQQHTSGGEGLTSEPQVHLLHLNVHI